MTTLTFNNQPLQVIDRDGQRWLTAADLARALDYQDPKAISRIYNRHKREFTDQMTLVVKLTTSRGKGKMLKETRIFSLRGCYLVGMFARTKTAEQLRVWVLDILERENKTAIAYTQNPSDTLTAEEADQLRAFLTSEAVKQYPNNTKKQGEFLKLGWSRLKAHFKVSYRQIPRAQLAEALSIIGRFSAAHRESYTPTLLGRTFIVYVDADGTESIKEKPADAGINRTEDWARMVREPGGLMMSQDWHEDLSLACFERMTPERKLKSLERQLAYMNEQVGSGKVTMRWVA